MHESPRAPARWQAHKWSLHAKRLREHRAARDKRALVGSVRIWLITVGEPLPGLSSNSRPWRTGLLANELTARGHDVLWWTSTIDHFSKRHFVEGEPRVRVHAGLDLQFLRGCLYRTNISWSRFRNHREIARRFRALARSEPIPDAILVSFPTIELSDEAVRYGYEHGVPVHVDVRDLWPDELVRRLPPWLRWLGRAAVLPMQHQACRAMANATGIVAISESYLAWARMLAGRSGVDRDFLAPLGFKKPEIESGSVGGETVRRMLDQGVDPKLKIVWFCGTFVRSIDLGVAISAARLLRGKPAFQFVLSGTGEFEERWRQEASGLSNVVFTGWVGPQEQAWLSGQAWVGLAPYSRGALMSLPNKIFEYMSGGLPIVSSLDGEARQLLAQHEIGVFFEPEDGASLANLLLSLSADPEFVGRMANNARRVFSEFFDASIIYPRLASHIEIGCRAGA